MKKFNKDKELPSGHVDKVHAFEAIKVSHIDRAVFIDVGSWKDQVAKDDGKRSRLTSYSISFATFSASVLSQILSHTDAIESLLETELLKTKEWKD